MISTNAKIAIVDTTQGMELLTFSNRLEAVCVLMENARIAPKPEYFASPSHEAAIRVIQKHCETVLKAIEKDRAEEDLIEHGQETIHNPPPSATDG